MALIITLAILALLSVLLVSFVSMAALDRGSTKSYSQSLQADQIAQGALDQIVSQFQSEIADPALSTNSVPAAGGSNLYIPLASANAVPQRTAPYLANLATLVSYSGTNLYTAGAGTPNYSSGAVTQTASLNGRVISTSSWNKPQLTTSAANFPDPKWIMMTRSGPEAFSVYDPTLANSAALNTNYAVGRFAYVVYDTSGLLDANVAGYPSTAPAANASGKGLMPWADLTQLGISQAAVNSLVNWRNATTASPASSYVTNVYYAATNNGFTRVANGDTAFLSRQELIKYAQTQAPDGTLTSALPYLTTFSREINGPTWGPTTPSGSTTNYATQQYVTGSFNPRIPNPRVRAAFTRNNGLPAVAGEPLVKYRFPLDKLALLEKYMGAGSGGLSSTDIANIQKYFGLDIGTTPNANGTPSATIDSNGPSYRHWNYPTTNPAYVHGVLSGTTGIMSLDDVAKENREPDFFELLQAGMLSGSLGAPGTGNKGRNDQLPGSGGNGSVNFVDPDDKVTLQILRIGANIIDQWGSENFPTTITYYYASPTTPGSTTYVNVEGIKDLPYPFAAYLNMYTPSPLTTTGQFNIGTVQPPFEFFLYFELWNPHQTPSSPVAANYPTNFRFSPYYNNSLPGNSDSFLAGFENSKVPQITAGPPPATNYVAGSWFYNGTATGKNGVANSHTPFYLTNIATSTGTGSGTYTGIPFSYSPTAAANDYREPALAVGSAVPPTSGAPSPWNTNACLVLPALTNFPNPDEPANQTGGSSVTFPTNAVGPVIPSPNSGWLCQSYLKMVMPVQYQDTTPAGNWHTYSTYLGLDDPAGAYTFGTGYVTYGGTSSVTNNAFISAPVFMKSDPRTFRFGFGLANPGSTPDVDVPLANLNGMGVAGTMPSVTTAPFGSASPYRMDLWAKNDGPVSSPPNPTYGDVDGVGRWGDARNSYQLSTPTSPLFTGEAANRPVILNRPFQSVGELGYAFRDMPWKTLDLYSANSADSGLLDLFTLSDPPLVAGRVNPNTPYPQVLAALISGANQSTVNSTTVSSANALAIGQAIQSATAVSPFITRADLVNDFMTNSAITSMSAIKTEEEAAVRAVAESSNTRTWTFMIDIIAQSGRYPTTASSLDNFVVEGERRYWLHVSIDRYTGQVVDKQLEVVNE
jgi:hypothetical protein